MTHQRDPVAIYVDGSCKGGEMFGSFKIGDLPVRTISLGKGTHQMAEALILLEAMNAAQEYDDCIFHTDSEWTYYKLHARDGRFAPDPQDAYYKKGNAHAELLQAIREQMAKHPGWEIVWNERSVSVAKLGH